MTFSEPTDLRRSLPSVDQLLEDPELRRLRELYGRAQVVVQVRRELDGIRSGIAERALGHEALTVALSTLSCRVRATLEGELGPPLRRVINATGVLLHTNLGRAPLPRSVAGRIASWVDAACDLEIDLKSGRRDERNRRCAALLRELTGAEAALVANNNASCLVLVLAALAADREVVVSRGELVEIGGSFRIADILEASGARLIEVGSTNRTRLDDYRRAIGPETGLVLKVHQSNYRIVGFTESVEVEELVDLAADVRVPLLVDEGAGLLRPRSEPLFSAHPSLSELTESGVDLSCGSGDKLLGGPQAGLLVGRRELVERCRRHPLYRAFRPSRLTYASLEAVLRMHLSEAVLPLDRLWPDSTSHQRRLERVGDRIGATIVEAEAFVGGGAAPERPIPGRALSVVAGGDRLARLRTGSPPVVGYERAGRVLLDLRTVDPNDDELLVNAVLATATGGTGSAV